MSKKFLALLSILFMSGCSTGSSYPNQKLIIDPEVSAMNRHEVIDAVNDCESNNLRAVYITSKKKVEGRLAEVITDVTCAPKPLQTCK